MNTLFRKLLSDNTGVTLVEVLISVFVLSIGVTGSLAYFTTAKSATLLSRDTTTAVTHGEYILEEMRALPTLAEIVSADDTEYWNNYVTAQGLNTLDNEAITVAFADPDGDPLNITVTIDWETNTRARTVSLTTELTK